MELEQAYRSVLQGHADPARAFVVRIAVRGCAVTTSPSTAEERAASSFLSFAAAAQENGTRFAAASSEGS